MRLKLSAFLWSALILMSCVAFSGPSARAQETELAVVDEVIAQINSDVITLSMVRRYMKEAIEARKQQGVSEQQATEEVSRRQSELIASLINEQLLVQKGKELGLAEEVENEVNKRILEVMKEQGIKTIPELEEAMTRNQMSLADVRTTLRTEVMKNMVLSREVDAKIYYGLSDKELQDYFKAHQDKFHKAESVTLSEIFLSFAGKSEAQVRDKAQQLVAQLRGGADFAKLAAANSERIDENGKRRALETGGKVGTFEVPNLRPDIAGAIKDVKAGAVSEPLRTDEGYQILRVDERTAGSNTAVFNENQVRQAILTERADKERDKYLQTLRDEGYIKINEAYRAGLEPFLKLKTQSAASATDKPTDKSAPKKGEKKP